MSERYNGKSWEDWKAEWLIEPDRYNFRTSERKWDSVWQHGGYASVVSTARRVRGLRCEVISLFAAAKGCPLPIAGSGEDIPDYDVIVDAYGKDMLRWAVTVETPEGKSADDYENGLTAAYRLVNKIFRLGNSVKAETDRFEEAEERAFAVTEALQRGSLHGAGALLSEWSSRKFMAKSEYKLFLRLIFPFLPHLAEEMWARLHEDSLLAGSPWPVVKPVSKKIWTVEINGRRRTSFRAAADIDENTARCLALEAAGRLISGKKTIKTFWVPGRLVNLVTDGI